jgi:preflagellin peptidase FlaK
VDSSATIAIARLIPATVVLGYASFLDLRTRRIPNPYWIALSAIGCALIPIQLILDEQPVEYSFILVPILLILADVYWDSGENSRYTRAATTLKYSLSVVSIAALAYLWGDAEYFQHMLGIPLMMLLFVMLYMLDVIKGGADAKALLALSILFPFYPKLSSIPILSASTATSEIWFPFSFVILVLAAILVALLPLGFLLINLSRGEFAFPAGLLGYRMDAREASKKHIWLMERIIDGKHQRYLNPKKDEDMHKEIGLLLQAGYTRVWVTPKIPFIVPMLASLLISAIIGNPVFLLFH